MSNSKDSIPDRRGGCDVCGVSIPISRTTCAPCLKAQAEPKRVFVGVENNAFCARYADGREKVYRRSGGALEALGEFVLMQAKELGIEFDSTMDPEWMHERAYLSCENCDGDLKPHVPAQASASPWVSCKERMPELLDEVSELVVVPDPYDGQWKIVRLENQTSLDGKRSRLIWYSRRGDPLWLENQVTHWMPIPALPKESEAK